MKFFFLFFILILPVAVNGADVIQAGCFLLNQKGVLIKNFPGNYCLYRENGDRIQVAKDHISYIDSEDNIIWTQPGYHHHQIKLDQDKKILVTLSEAPRKIMGCNTRYDSLVIYDLKTGKKKKIFDFYDIYKNEKYFQDLEPVYVLKSTHRMTQGNYRCETTHANSMFQLMDNSMAKIDPAFNAGNWIVNFSKNGIFFILDKNFEKILWLKSYNIQRESIHDVQLTNEGKIIAYLNAYQNKKMLNPETMIGVIDPALPPESALKLIALKDSGKPFYQSITGGIQFLKGDKKLISIYTDAQGYQLGFYDKNWNQYRKLTPFPSPRNKIGIIFQEARLINLSSFFKNYKGQL